MIASSVSPLLLVLLLACPLMMLFMMRGGHGHGHGGQGQDHAGGCHDGEHGSEDTGARTQSTLDELRDQRDDLDARIQALEDEEAEQLTPAR